MSIKEKTKNIKIKKVLYGAGITVLSIAIIAYTFYLVYMVAPFMNGEFTPLEIRAENMPSFVTHDQMDLKHVQEISKFRSSSGHDYSDTYENCRSMKHYYRTVDGDDPADYKTVPVYSPVDGQVVMFMPDQYDGTQILIRPKGYKNFTVSIFHLHVKEDLGLFDKVKAGEVIGTNKTNGNDISVAQYGPFGFKYRSFYRFMNNETFSRYKKYGITERSEFSYTKKERDAKNISCRWQGYFEDRAEEDFIYINYEPPEEESGSEMML